MLIMYKILMGMISNKRLCFQNTYEPGNPQCVADALFEIQRKARENNDEMQLSDDSLYAINTNILFAGMDLIDTCRIDKLTFSEF